MSLPRRNRLAIIGLQPAYNFLGLDDDEIIPKCAFNWPVVRDYLVGKRMIPSQVIDTLHDAGMVYADAQTPEPNVVYVHRDGKRKIRGASICGINNSSINPCYKGEKEAAWFYIGDLINAHRMAVVDSPMDALSYYILKGDPGTVVVSCVGSIVPHELLECALHRKQSLIVAFNKTQAGELGWQQAIEKTAKWTTFKISSLCPKGNDWNSELSLEMQKPPSIKI